MAARRITRQKSTQGRLTSLLTAASIATVVSQDIATRTRVRQRVANRLVAQILDIKYPPFLPALLGLPSIPARICPLITITRRVSQRPPVVIHTARKREITPRRTREITTLMAAVRRRQSRPT